MQAETSNPVVPHQISFRWVRATVIVLLTLGALALAHYTLIGYPKLVRDAKHNRSSAALRAIMSGLESYRLDYGEYPALAQSEPVLFSAGGGDRWYDSNAARTLYQALTGDGTDHIAILGPNRGKPSDGQVDHSELSNATLFDMPKELWRKTDAGFILVDGFGHPFQYTPPGPETVNQNYDLWSFGGTSPPAIRIDKATKQSPASDRWIKNW